VDTIPPIVVSTSPANADTGVGVSSNVLAVFSEALDPLTIIPEAFDVHGAVSGVHTGSVSYNNVNYSAVFNPDIDFNYAETVYVTISDTITDLFGNKLDGDNNGSPGGDYTFWFYTASSPDTTPPGVVNDLQCSDIGSTDVTLQWTAPGDDGYTGQASYYDLRYATFMITEGNFATASEAANEPPPSYAGQIDSCTILGLASGTLYYFALKTADEDSNWSLISNVPSCTTQSPLDTLIVLNELFVDPVTYDHNNNGNYGDADEEFIEVLNKNTTTIAIADYRITDHMGANSMTMPSSFSIPAQGYMLAYASGEALVISGDGDTVHAASWSGTWTTLDQTGDTIMLWDAQAREIDRKAYISTVVVPDFAIARLPNGSSVWVNNAFPTPGHSNGSQYIWPIAVAFQDLDSNYVPDLLDSVVTITGIITVPPGIFSYNDAYIQDNTGGVNMYGDFPVTLDYGDSITVTGTVDQYRGKSEITNFSYTLEASNVALPDPVMINGTTMNTEKYEGMLVSIRLSYFDGFLLEGDYNYNAYDTLNMQFVVRIDANTNIPGALAPIDTFTITGIKGQYSYSDPPDDGYQLMPRDTFDFSHLFEMPAIKTIAEVQSPDTDGVTSKYVDSLVAVEGVVTGPNYVFTSGSPSFYIQDNTAGINIYDMNGDSDVLTFIDSLGARIRLVGIVTEYNGLTEIAHGYGWFLGMDTVPRARDLPRSTFLTESMEGTLVKFTGVIKTAPYKTGDGYNMDVANGDVGLTVRFTSGTGINPLSIHKDDLRVIYGIVGQYDYESPFTSGYQVLLRFPEDLVVPGYDSASATPRVSLGGPKTFIPSIGEHAEIRINSPVDHGLELKIYDMHYRAVRTLYTGAGGPQILYWDGRDQYARPCPLGIYLLNLKAIAPDGNAVFERLLVVIGAQ
jgi:DNA/RNA endonuclease YhcR with UshA esterase domain